MLKMAHAATEIFITYFLIVKYIVINENLLSRLLQ